VDGGFVKAGSVGQIETNIKLDAFFTVDRQVYKVINISGYGYAGCCIYQGF